MFKAAGLVNINDEDFSDEDPPPYIPRWPSLHAERNPMRRNLSRWKPAESYERRTTLPSNAIVARPSPLPPDNQTPTEAIKGPGSVVQHQDAAPETRETEENLEAEVIRLFVIDFKDNRDLAAREEEVEDQTKMEGNPGDGKDFESTEEAAWDALKEERKTALRKQLWQPEDWERRKRLWNALDAMKEKGEMEA